MPTRIVQEAHPPQDTIDIQDIQAINNLALLYLRAVLSSHNPTLFALPGPFEYTPRPRATEHKPQDMYTETLAHCY